MKEGWQCKALRRKDSLTQPRRLYRRRPHHHTITKRVASEPYYAMALTEIDHLTDEMAECIDNCFEAAQACENCADACAEEGEEMARCLRLCRDVADLTTLHARLMARNSGYHSNLAETCAVACKECADECEQHDQDHCQLCAEILRECAASCREMASA